MRASDQHQEWVDRIHQAINELPDPPRRVRFLFWIEDVAAEIRRRLTS